MFNFIGSPSEEERQGNIPYQEAIKRADKNPKGHLITTVSWDDYPNPEWEKVYVKTLEKEYNLAIEPKLPIGYQMVPHDSWLKLNDDFLEAIKQEESPEKQHDLFQEMESFVTKYGEFRFISLISMVNNEDYLNEAYFEWEAENYPIL